MPTSVRIPITNVINDGDYTGVLYVGPAKQPVNVILDTGSSSLAISGRKFQPAPGASEVSTRLAQSDAYGDGSHWTGAVLNMPVTLGSGPGAVTAPSVPVAVAYDESSDMFSGCDGILGLAYEALDSAHRMAGDTWKKKYTTAEVNARPTVDVVPYLTQLAKDDILPEKVAFLTRRSFVHAGAGLASDPLNQGWMIIGGGEEATDLYKGKFQVAKVLSQAWYCTHLQQIVVDGSPAINVRARGPQGMPSNSIVDSGTNSLCLGPSLLKQVLANFSSAQQAQLNQAMAGTPVDVNALKLSSWPTLTFVLQGQDADVTLKVAPGDYWQVNAPRPGQALVAITSGQEGLAILGLPLMNGYFTIFDGTADGGMGVVKFANAVR